MDIITQVVLPLILAFIMFSMGLSLVIEDFKRVTQFPKAFFIGFALQVVALPMIAFALAHAWNYITPLDASLSVGLIILAACPGGVTSNLMTHLAKGDTALSISLTAIISVFSIFTIPFIVNLGLSQFMGENPGASLPVAKTVIGIFCITTVPVALGMMIKAKKPTLADQFEPLAKKIATVLFVIIVLAAVAKKWDLLTSSFSTIGPITLLLNVITMLLAYFVAKGLCLKAEQRTAITFECGLQNGTLAITIAVTFLGNEAMMIPGGVYSLLMFATGGIYLWFCRRNGPSSHAA